MNYANIKKTDVANGPGIRVSLFVSGCTHRCKACFNAEAWDFSYGWPYTDEIQEEILEALAPDYIRGLSLLGGEPMEQQNRGVILELVREAKKRYPDKKIWCYSGYLWEDLTIWSGLRMPQTWQEKDGLSQPITATGPVLDAEGVKELLTLLDVLVDGEFVEAEKNLRLQFRGSANQRIIDVQASLADPAKAPVLLAGIAQ